MEEMLTIPGAARKTANVVLGTAYGIASGVVVDTHVSAHLAASGSDEEYRPGEDRAGSGQDHPQENAGFCFRTRSFCTGARSAWRAAPECAECDLNSLCYAKDKRA